MNLRGKVIPIIDLAQRLGMAKSTSSERSAIVVTEIGSMIIGILVDRVSDILTIQSRDIHPVPEITTSFDKSFAYGIITRVSGMICFLNLDDMFAKEAAAA
jgi:purine-binding chemotaxis protein CheW